MGLQTIGKDVLTRPDQTRPDHLFEYVQPKPQAHIATNRLWLPGRITRLGSQEQPSRSNAYTQMEQKKRKVTFINLAGYL